MLDIGIGLRDPSALESALGRQRNQWTYGEADLCVLAAAYAYGVARNRPFTDPPGYWRTCSSH